MFSTLKLGYLNEQSLVTRFVGLLRPQHPSSQTSDTRTTGWELETTNRGEYPMSVGSNDRWIQWLLNPMSCVIKFQTWMLSMETRICFFNRVRPKLEQQVPKIFLSPEATEPPSRPTKTKHRRNFGWKSYRYYDWYASVKISGKVQLLCKGPTWLLIVIW